MPAVATRAKATRIQFRKPGGQGAAVAVLDICLRDCRSPRAKACAAESASGQSSACAVEVATASRTGTATSADRQVLLFAVDRAVPDQVRGRPCR